MKLVVIVGSEGHTTSRASARLEYGKDGFWVQTPREWNKKWNTLERDGHANWYELELDVPAGTALRYKCSGRTGPRGVNAHETTLQFVMDEAAEVIEETPD